MIYTLLTIYVICAFIMYGLGFAYWQREYASISHYHYIQDLLVSILFGILFPVSFITFILSNMRKFGFTNIFKHGLKFK